MKLTAAAGRCTREILKTLVRVTAAIVGSLDQRYFLHITALKNGLFFQLFVPTIGTNHQAGKKVFYISLTIGGCALL